MILSYDTTNEENGESNQEMITAKIEGVRKRIIRSNPSTPLSTSSSFVSMLSTQKQLHSPGSGSDISVQFNESKIFAEDTKFHATIDFVRAYLDNVVQQTSPFGDKEQNKLTFEVIYLD